MHFKAKNVAALQMILGGWPDRTRVEVDPDIGLSAKTVGDLKKVTAWPDNLAIATPPDDLPGEVIRVSRASHATRFTPKP